MKKIHLPALAALVCLAPVLAGDEEAWRHPQPLPRAHAHNDYLHPRPCLDALAHGFTSIEADIHLVDGELLVAHDLHKARPGRTLQRLYLEPLAERARKFKGRVHPQHDHFTLLIDFKSNGEKTYAVLREVLARYADVLTRVEDGKLHPGAVTVVISGNRPKEMIAKDARRFCGIDGRLSDLDSDQPAHLMPLISDRWSSHFRWRGLGSISPEERTKLRDIVTKAHAKGRRVRFWATPELLGVWRELAEAKVDHINTDDLCGLQRFLLNRTHDAAK